MMENEEGSYATQHLIPLKWIIYVKQVYCFQQICHKISIYQKINNGLTIELLSIKNVWQYSDRNFHYQELCGRNLFWPWVIVL